MNYNQYRIYYFFLYIGIIFSTPNKEILQINEELSNIFHLYTNFDIEENINSINNLQERCDRIDYLQCESLFLEVKLGNAIWQDKEQRINNLLDQYDRKINQAIKLSLAEKELYYRTLKFEIHVFQDVDQ